MVSEDQHKWARRFLKIAKEIATWSKDPSTKCGCVIVYDRRIIATGYNGFPRDVKDLPERYEDRELKYSMVVHAESNAIVNAVAPLEGATLYVTGSPCCDCAKLICQTGIEDIVSIPDSPEFELRWADSIEVTKLLFRESGIEWNTISSMP
jgi:dCMP deaminase